MYRCKNRTLIKAKKGGIAQLVERCLCKADVSGSSPLTSTKTNQIRNNPQQCGALKKLQTAGVLTPDKYLENCIAKNQAKKVENQKIQVVKKD